MNCSFVVEPESFEASNRATARLNMPVGETARLKTCVAAALHGEQRSCLGMLDMSSSVEMLFCGYTAFAHLPSVRVPGFRSQAKEFVS
jgi:hypothetical protein